MPMTIEEMKTACVRSESFGAAEPVLANAELPHKVTFYPLGFPVEIVTNSQEILDAAAESWLGYARLFKTKPIQVHIHCNNFSPGYTGKFHCAQSNGSGAYNQHIFAWAYPGPAHTMCANSQGFNQRKLVIA